MSIKNVISNIGKLHWQENSFLELRIGSHTQQISAIASHMTIADTSIESIRTAYHEVNTGDLILQVDSNGYLEIAINQGNAGERLNVSIHDTITLFLD